MRASFIKKVLSYRHAEDFFLLEVKTGASWGGEYGKIDAWAMEKSWSKPRVIAYEIKVNRSDFVNDNKWMRYVDCCNEFYFICPVGLIKADEISKEVGLKYVHEKSGFIKTVKKAHYREKAFNEDMWRYIIMNRIESDRWPFHNSRAEYLKDFLDQKISFRDLSYRVNGSLIKRLQVAEEEAKSNKEAAEHVKKIKELFEANNIRCYWNVAESVNDLIAESKAKIGTKSSLKVIERIQKLCEEHILEAA